ncbi:MAG: hypothetical protein MNPFHGCM_02952 [Gemmatimonadaceae bacterium]|nr:hypothetical protein [Gemmatimonadaceae bacterium]
MRFLAFFLSTAIVAGSAPDPIAAQRQTRNVVLIVTDGLRWQEVFSGAERALLSAQPGGARDTTGLIRDFWRSTPEARREALLPFFWKTIGKQGVIYGNQTKGSIARITNTMKFSYPGYNEIFTGAFDPRIDSNGYPPNPNVTVFEWLAKKPELADKVGAVATWSAFRRILNKERSGLPILDGWDPPFAADSARSERAALIDELYRTSIQMWPDNAFDAPMNLAANEFIRTRRPRVLFVGYGETDEWAHSGRYDLVLRSAHQVDAFIAELWLTMQRMPQYRGVTTFIITTDHGRGSGPTAWRDHGQDVAGAENIWIAMLGPDTPALGEMTSGTVTQSQIAATVAALLGEDWTVANPRAGKPLR